MIYRSLVQTNTKFRLHNIAIWKNMKNQSSIDGKYYYVKTHCVIFHSDRPENDKALGSALRLG